MSKGPTITHEEAAAKAYALGAYVRGLREAVDLTQNELADLARLENKQSISAIETGRTGIPSERLALFADALRVDRAEFMKNILTLV